MEEKPGQARSEARASIFLSYAHVDNEPEKPETVERGWVDYFQVCLQRQFKRRGRPDVQFWRDVAEIPNAVRFTPAILEGLAQCYVFLPVVSPTYIERPWCQEEIAKFIARSAADPGIDQRIAPVYKLPVDRADLPEALKGRAGYRFYRNDEIKNTPVEFFRRGEETDPNAYSAALDEIAEYVCSILPKGHPVAPIVNPKPDADTITVFIADPAPDMYAAYDRITDELKRTGFRVLTDPGTNLPLEPAGLEAAIAEALSNAKLAVHLLGQEPGPRVGSSRLVDKQLELTLANPMPRLIWAPQILLNDPTRPDSAERAKRPEPIEVLKSFGDFRNGDSLSGAPLEAFLQDLVRHCDNFRPVASRLALPAGADGARVYVIGATEDASLVDNVTGMLIDTHHLNANACMFEGRPDEVTQLHEEEMREADALLYCWGNASPACIGSYTREAGMAAKFGRQTPYRASALLPGPPLEGRKLTFRTANITLPLPPTAVVTPATLTPFVQALSR